MRFWRLVSPEQFTQAALTGHHVHWLCLVAVLLAILAAWVMLPVTERFHSGNARHRYWWLAAGSVAMGTGIWAMHFTGMLAFSLPVPIRYDISITTLSVVPAIIASGCCILLYSPSQYSIKRLQLSALLLALGIGTMHYTGMEAIITPAKMYYVPGYFLLSIMAAYVLAVVGLYARTRLPERLNWSPLMATLTGSIILGLAVSSMHFIAMHATYFQPDATGLVTHHSIPPYNLIAGIISTTIILFGMIIIGSIVDRRMESMAQSLEQSELRFQRLAETTQTAIFTFDERAVTYANPALSYITGHDEKDILNMNLAEIFNKEFTRFATSALTSDTPYNQAFYEQFEITTASGEQRWLYFSLTLVEIDGDNLCLASACDITDQKKAELDLHSLAYSDQLTGLSNRVMFIDRLTHHLDLLKRKHHHGHSYAMLLDLDEFKSVNDSYGHLQGDQLLQEISLRLQALTRSGDTIARLGGDEFVLLLEELDSELDISDIAARILESLSQPVTIVQRDVQVHCSIGIVELVPGVYEKPDQVLHDMDIAMYRAKQEGGSIWKVFDQELDARVKRVRILQSELKTAIEERQLQLYYQPIVDATDQNLMGFEALCRWQRNNGEWVSPAEFIPLAEKTGSIGEISLWAVETAARQLAEWSRDSGRDDLYISVNVASVSFEDNRLFDNISRLMEKYRFKPGQLKLELTESMLVRDTDKIIPKLDCLIGLGCELMIDDFGTGYSSLSYLHLLPVRTVKIDRSFVSHLEHNESTVPVIKSIIALARSLNMDVISEGVETEQQARHLSQLGSDKLQGYLFSRPVPACEAIAFLQARHSARDEELV